MTVTAAGPDEVAAVITDLPVHTLPRSRALTR